MFERLATRSLFWGVLAICASAGGLLSVGTSSHFSATTAFGLGLPRLMGSGLPSFTDVAPLISLAAFMMALVGLVLLRRVLADGDDNATAVGESDRARQQQMHDAMFASADGIFLLRPVKDAQGDANDFEIADVNPAGAALVRSERSALLGKRLRRDFPVSIYEPAISRYSAVLNSRAPLSEEVRVSRRMFAGGWLGHQVVPTGEGLAVTLRDTSARKREELQLRRASLTDELTRLYNRRGFLMLADQQLRIARRQMKDAVMLYVDMDDFKALNDQFGHAEGDRALAAVSRLLRKAVRDCDVVGRMGGDEFTIMALDADRVAARIIQRRIEERLALLNASGELAAPLSLTIGHTRVRPTDSAGVAELLARADSLLYARKKRRKLTLATTERAAQRSATRSRPRPTIGTRSLNNGVLPVPPEVAAIARATAVAAAARLPQAPVGRPYSVNRAS